MKILAIPTIASSFARCHNDTGAGNASPHLLKTIADLNLLPARVDPDLPAAYARSITSGHRLRGLAVVEQGRLVGVVTSERLAAAPADARVRDLMEAPQHVASKAMTIREVAELMARESLDLLPVLEKEAFLGVVTPFMLLTEIGRTWDPLTGLPWSDRLREWGVEQLQSGRELVIVFVDLDEFGQYNKRFGHIVGDRVLQSVAHLLRDTTFEPEDLLVRYGGDEFVIGTVRSRAQVDKLVEAIDAGLSHLVVEEAKEPVSASVGVFGGRRTHERESIHFAATLDSLINLASKDAQAKKAAKAAVRKASEVPGWAPGTAPEGPPSHGVLVVDVGADDRAPGGLTTVMLSRGDTVVSGVHARGAEPLVESVVRATLKALERMEPSIAFSLGEVKLLEDPSGAKLVSVSGFVIRLDERQPAAAVRRITSNLFEAAAQATLDAALS